MLIYIQCGIPFANSLKDSNTSIIPGLNDEAFSSATDLDRLPLSFKVLLRIPYTFFGGLEMKILGKKFHDMSPIIQKPYMYIRCGN